MNNKQNNGFSRNGEGNRLVGWLVSYGLNDSGAHFEIRAGRSLLTSDSKDGRGIISITEDTISAPHMALSASAKHQVLVQDIFSACGTYITKSGSSDERPLDGPVELQHGDWIRVGDNTRFQVCLIDGPRR